MVLFISPKNKSYLAPREMTTMFFPVELIQMLGLRVMLTNKTWALAWLISTGRLELGSIELEHIALHVLSLHGVLLSLPFPQEH